MSEGTPTMCGSLTLLPLDVLVATRRQVEWFQDLSSDEVGDLFVCAHRVAPVIRKVYGGTSLTISIQVQYNIISPPLFLSFSHSL